MHKHIYSFCGEEGCKDRPYHPNTENLVSPALDDSNITKYFSDTSNIDGRDDYAILVCEGECINPLGMWLFIRPTSEMTALFRPNHYDPDYWRWSAGGPDLTSNIWAKK